MVKRPLAVLKVGDGWRADLDRTGNEAAVAAVLHQVAPQHALPVVAFDAQRNVLLMEAAPEPWRSWKQWMLAGAVDVQVAHGAGNLFRRIHDAGSHHPDAAQIHGRKHFESLRIDPFLRWLLPRHPDVADELHAVIALLEPPGDHLVHGDSSPKNIPVSDKGQIHLIDHEVAHLGDPQVSACAAPSST